MGNRCFTPKQDLNMIPSHIFIQEPIPVFKGNKKESQKGDGKGASDKIDDDPEDLLDDIVTSGD